MNNGDSTLIFIFVFLFVLCYYQINYLNNLIIQKEGSIMGGLGIIGTILLILLVLWLLKII